MLKLPLKNSFAILCRHVKEAKATAAQAGAAVADLAEATVQELGDIGAILDEINGEVV